MRSRNDRPCLWLSARKENMFIHPFTDPFEHLPCLKHCSRNWECGPELNKETVCLEKKETKIKEKKKLGDPFKGN